MRGSRRATRSSSARRTPVKNNGDARKYARMAPSGMPVLRPGSAILDSLHQKEEITMHKLTSLCLAVVAAALVAACSDGTGGSSSIVDGSTARGTLIFNPPLRVATLTAADFAAQLNASGT